MKLQKAANALFILCFLGFLAAGMLVTAVKPKETESFFENRTLAAAPELNRDSFMNGSWFAGWEDYLKDHAAGRENLLEAAAYLDLFVLKRPVVNDIVVTDDMLLSFNNYETVDADSISNQSQKMTANLKALSQIVEDSGGVFYCVAVPGQMAYFSGSYPSYLNSRDAYVSTIRSYFKEDMSTDGVNLIDMGDIFDAMGHPSGFYSATDHHYTFDGAFQAYQSILERISADTHWKLPILTSKDITIKTLENPFLGSRARKIFNMMSNGEQLKIGILNQEIPFTRTDNGNTVAPKVYSIPQNTWETVTYNVYMGGDVGETVINTNRPNLPNVLIFGESYTNAVECLLYTSFNEMHAIDLRSYHDKSLADYVRDYKPDVVILLRDYPWLLSFEMNGTVF